MSEIQIFKFQVSINEPSQVLIYNEDRSSIGIIPNSKELSKLMGKEPKKFFHGIHREDGQIEILTEADWQDW